jgi:hypothetical protein
MSVHNFTISFMAPALYNVRTFPVAIFISLILFHCPDRFHSAWLSQDHHLGFLTVTLFTVTGCRPVAQLQPGGTVHRIYKPLGTLAHLYPRHQVPILVVFLRTAWAAMRHILQVTKREIYQNYNFVNKDQTWFYWSRVKKCVWNLCVWFRRDSPSGPHPDH